MWGKGGKNMASTTLIAPRLVDSRINLGGISYSASPRLSPRSDMPGIMPFTSPFSAVTRDQVLSGNNDLTKQQASPYFGPAITYILNLFLGSTANSSVVLEPQMIFNIPGYGSLGNTEVIGYLPSPVNSTIAKFLDGVRDKIARATERFKKLVSPSSVLPAEQRISSNGEDAFPAGISVFGRFSSSFLNFRRAELIRGERENSQYFLNWAIELWRELRGYSAIHLSEVF